MADLRKIRFVTVNYSRLQGLKAVPPGLVLILTILWSNAHTGRTRDLTLPVLYLAGGIILYAVFDRYYRMKFGRVQQTPRTLWADVILSVAFSVAALWGFSVDISMKFPISVFALVFALGLLMDYFRMLRIAGVSNPAFFPLGLIFITGIALSAFLPLLEEPDLTAFCFRSPLFLVYAVDGILILVYGLAGHAYLVRSMASPEEVGDGQPV
jgi:hypothetical protein